jgi:uncharacterized protein
MVKASVIVDRVAWLFGLLVMALLLQAPNTAAQSPARTSSRQAPSEATGPVTIEAMRERVNAGTVGIVSGGVDGTYIRIATDLAAALDGDNLRILAMAGKGSVQNVLDIMYLRGVDVGIVQSDVLAYLKRERDRRTSGLEKSIQYITKLYNEEVHLLGQRGITSVQALAGKKVNVDVKGSGTFITASLIFAKLGIPIEPTHFDQALALEKLKAGEIAALVYVAGKPTRLFTNVKADDGLHFVPVPNSDSLLDTYLPSLLSAGDYPALVPADSVVETIAVGAVMAVYGWPSDSQRYRNVARFVDAFFSRFPEFLQAPRHAKWKEVNLATTLPGWTRFAAADQWLRAAAGNEGPQQRQDFNRFVEQTGRAGQPMTPAQREALFSQFLEWQRSNAAAQSSARPR